MKISDILGKKSNVEQQPISTEELELAKAISLKLTPEQFYALTRIAKSKALWPGLLAYFEYKANL